MSALDRTEDPQSSSPLFAAFTMVFFVAEVFGYEGLSHVGFLVLSLALAAAMVLIGICMYVIPDAGSTEPTDRPDAPTSAIDPVDATLLDNPVVLQVPNPERITDEPMDPFLHGLTYDVERSRDAADRKLAKAVREFNENVISR